MRNRIELDQKTAISVPLNHSWVVNRRERKRRLAHAERAWNDDGPVLFENRLDELLEPILAANHFRIGRQRRGEGALGWQRRSQGGLRRSALARCSAECRGVPARKCSGFLARSKPRSVCSGQESARVQTEDLRA